MAITHEPQGDELERMARALQQEKEAGRNDFVPEAPEENNLDEPEVTGMQMQTGDVLDRTDEAQEEEIEEEGVETEVANETDTTVMPATPPKEINTEIFEKREEPPRGKKKTWKIIGAGVAVLTLLGGGAALAVTGAGSNPREQAIEPVPEDLAPSTTGAVTVTSAETAPSSSVPGNTGTSTPETTPETSTPTGGFNPGEIVKGEPTIEGKLPNGETIVAAELASIGEGPDRVAETFFGLVRAYANSKDQKFLDAISTNPKVQSQITSAIDSMEEFAMEQSGLSELPDNYVAEVFGNPDQAPKFAAAEYDKDSIILSLSEGDVRFNPFISSNGKAYPLGDPMIKRTDYSFSFSIDRSTTTIQIGRNPQTGKSQAEDVYWKWKTPGGELDRDVNN